MDHPLRQISVRRSTHIWRGLAIAALTVIGLPSAGGAESNTVDLTGRSRVEVEQHLGKAASVLRRGEVEILVFADGTRVELRNGEVISTRGNAGEIVAADGTRYTVDATGMVRTERMAAQLQHASAAEASAVEQVVSSDSQAADEPAEVAPVEAEVATPEQEIEHPGLALAAEAEKMLKLAEGGEEDVPESAAPPWVGQLIGVGAHFAIVAIVLSLSLKWVGIPFVWWDLARVSVVYLAVRELFHGLGGLGGHWEFIRLFRVDELVSFVALSILLYRFKVVLSGLSALKVAAATKFVSYMLMIGVGLAVSFGLLALS